MTRPDLPVTLDFSGRRVLVVGGGHVASRRVRTFVQASAEVVLVAPAITHELREAAERGRIVWHERPFAPEDLQDVWFVQIATDDPTVDAAVAARCEAARLWYLKGGDPEASPAWMPAVARTDDLIVAVNGGRDPRRAALLRDAIAAALDAGDLPVRAQRRPAGGKVSLVGGGPGSGDLLTARGRRLLADADVVVVDRLAPHDVLEELSDDVLVIDVGKRPTHHPVPQDDITRLLIEHAEQGRHVVRLKGGDPFVFGRGGEERLACEEHGLEVEVVPGISSAIAVPTAAGIPVTHRGLARGFTVITAHDDVGAIAYRPDHTLVLLMGVSTLLGACERLVEHGWPTDLPAAIIEQGWRPDQRVTTGALGSLPELARSRKVSSPAVVVIGEVVRLSPAWSAETSLPHP